MEYLKRGTSCQLNFTFNLPFRTFHLWYFILNEMFVTVSILQTYVKK